jgi:hypothetical protein
VDRLAQFDISLDDMLKSNFWDLQRHARLERAANGHGTFVERSARRPLNFSLGGNAYFLEERPNLHVDPIFVHRALRRCRASTQGIVSHSDTAPTAVGQIEYPATREVPHRGLGRTVNAERWRALRGGGRCVQDDRAAVTKQGTVVVGALPSHEKKTSPIAATPSAMSDWAVVRNRPTADPASSPVTPLLPITVLMSAGCASPWPLTADPHMYDRSIRRDILGSEPGWKWLHVCASGHEHIFLMR